LEQTPTRTEVASLTSAIAAALMGARGGSIRFLDTDEDGEPDTLYVADNPEPTLATKVWRWNYAGWAASSNGYDGPFTMAATLEGGIIADYITAGIIRSVTGDFSISLDTGVLNTIGTKTYYAADYTSDDVSRIVQITVGSVTPTDADFEKYDFYQDGEITIVDLAIAQRLVNTGTDFTIEWNARVEPSSRGAAFSVWMNGSRVARIGVNVMEAQKGKFSEIDSNVVVGETEIRGGTIRCDHLYINGQEVTP